MKRLSDKTLQLVLQLYQERDSWLKRSILGSSKALSLVGEIAASNEPAAIRYLAPLLYQLSGKLAIEVAGTIERLLPVLTQADYTALDQQLRGIADFYFPALKLEDISDFRDFSDLEWVPLCFATMCCSGYVREKSVRAVCELKNPVTLPFLLIRANDWVNQVCDAAAEGVKQFLSPRHAEHIVQNLYLILRLQSGRVKDRSGVASEALNVLRHADARAVLFKALKDGDLCVRRLCFQIALDLDDIGLNTIIRMGLDDPDVLIRGKCANKLRTLGGDPEVLELIRGALADSHVIVRQKTLAALATFEFSQVRDLLFERLCDPSSAVRQSCRSIISRCEAKEPSYFAAFYKAQLSGDGSFLLTSAISALSEVGEKSDYAVLRPFLSHRHAKVRRAAVRSIAKLSGNECEDEFYKHLAADTRGVSREAAIALSKLKPFPSVEKLSRLIEEAQPIHAKLNVLWLISMLPKWDRINCLLRLLPGSCVEIRERSKEYLQLWVTDFNKGGTSTTSARLQTTRDTLDQVRSHLDPTFVKRLEFFLRS